MSVLKLLTDAEYSIVHEMVEYVILYLATLHCWTFRLFSLYYCLRQYCYEYFKPTSSYTGLIIFLG